MFYTRLLVVIGTLIFGSFIETVDAQSSGDVRAKKFGDWHYRCTDNIADNCEVTHIAQMIEGGEKIDVLTIAIAKDRLNKGDYLLAAIVPFHDVAPRGIDIHVDGQPLVTIPYYDCSKTGCRAQIRVGQTKLQALQRGISGEARLHFRDGNSPSLRFSLMGLTKAMNQL